MNLKIKNCNNVKEANLEILEDTVNIFFAPNGTGKTTIAKAIFWNRNYSKLQSLKPYNSKESPHVDCHVDTIKVFDESYINNFLFSESDKSLFFGEKCYEVFFKNKEFEDGKILLQNKMQKLISIYKDVNPDKFIQNFYMQLLNGKKRFEFIGGYSDIIKGFGYGFEKHKQFDKYETFYKKDYATIGKWSKWKMDGDKYAEKDLCPFCGGTIKTETINKETKDFKKIFKNAALEKTDMFVSFLDECINRNYISKETYEKTVSLFGDPSLVVQRKNTLEELVYEIKEVSEIYDKIDSLINIELKASNANELKNIFEDYKIRIKEDLKFFNTKNIIEKFKCFNSEIDSLLTDINKVLIEYKDVVSKYKNIANKNSKVINEILRKTGMAYNIKIDDSKTSFAVLNLYYDNYMVSDIEERLSFGEKNCFAMIMFLFECLHENPSLIILDDPIAAFDDNKKYAMVRHLFFEKTFSFNKKTVLLLTHDSHPIIEFYLRGVRDTNYKYLINNNGIIEVKDIVPENDLVNVVKWSSEIAKNISQDNEKTFDYLVQTRIVNLRKYIEFNGIGKTIESECAYNILSRLIHNKKEIRRVGSSKKLDDGELLTEEEKQLGFNYIKQFISDFDYDSFINKFSYESLIPIFMDNNISWYERIITIRLILEINDSHLKALTSENPGLAKFINQTNHIENDYILQLNPIKFMELNNTNYQCIINFLKSQNYGSDDKRKNILNVIKLAS